MSTSGTYTFGLTNGSVILEAFDRIGRQPTAVGRHELLSARTSLNLELISWENEEWNFWKSVEGVIDLVPGQAVYPMPANLVTAEQMWFRTANVIGPGISSDRLLLPISGNEYQLLVNKLQPGVTTRFWFQMLTPPQVTFWMVPPLGGGAPTYTIGWYGLQQMQDAQLGSGQNPEVPRRALDALCARMALRLCEKFGPTNPQERQAMMVEKKLLADTAWEALQRRDQELGTTQYRPNVSSWARMR